MWLKDRAIILQDAPFEMTKRTYNEHPIALALCKLHKDALAKHLVEQDAHRQHY